MHKSASTYMCEKCIASASICNLIGSCCQGWSSTRAMKIICQMFCSTYLRAVFGMQTIWRQEDGNIAPTVRADRVDGKIQHHLPVLRPFRHRSWCRTFSINHISWIKLCAIQSGQEGSSEPWTSWLLPIPKLVNLQGIVAEICCKCCEILPSDFIPAVLCDDKQRRDGHAPTDPVKLEKFARLMSTLDLITYRTFLHRKWWNTSGAVFGHKQYFTTFADILKLLRQFLKFLKHYWCKSFATKVEHRTGWTKLPSIWQSWLMELLREDPHWRLGGALHDIEINRDTIFQNFEGEPFIPHSQRVKEFSKWSW